MTEFWARLSSEINLKLTVFTLDRQMLEISEYRRPCPVCLTLLQYNAPEGLCISFVFTKSTEHVCLQPLCDRDEVSLLKRMAVKVARVLAGGGIDEETKERISQRMEDMERLWKMDLGLRSEMDSITVKKKAKREAEGKEEGKSSGTLGGVGESSASKVQELGEFKRQDEKILHSNPSGNQGLPSFVKQLPMNPNHPYPLPLNISGIANKDQTSADRPFYAESVNPSRSGIHEEQKVNKFIPVSLNQESKPSQYPIPRSGPPPPPQSSSLLNSEPIPGDLFTNKPHCPECEKGPFDMCPLPCGCPIGFECFQMSYLTQKCVMCEAPLTSDFIEIAQVYLS